MNDEFLINKIITRNDGGKARVIVTRAEIDGLPDEEINDLIRARYAVAQKLEVSNNNAAA